MKFRKKPVETNARKASKTEYIETLEGVMRADPGDWIITGVNGEEYPCKPDIFEKTYEPVDQEACAAFYVNCKDCKLKDRCAISGGFDGLNPDWFCADGTKSDEGMEG